LYQELVPRQVAVLFDHKQPLAGGLLDRQTTEELTKLIPTSAKSEMPLSTGHIAPRGNSGTDCIEPEVEERFVLNRIRHAMISPMPTS
jgi:hypothetical protein